MCMAATEFLKRKTGGHRVGGHIEVVQKDGGRMASMVDGNIGKWRSCCLIPVRIRVEE